MALSKSTRLGPYEILAPIGAGGMGEVYRARDTRLGRDVAIKVLPPAFASDPNRVHRFELEARATGLLNHPNILAIHDIGAYEGSPYLVAELLEGQTLFERLHVQPLNIRKAMDFGLQIARGLAAAHAKGIAHRDLKPSNIFITSAGHVKILDFGLASITQREHEDGAAPEETTETLHTRPGAVLGTAGYMSPEQASGRNVDFRSDLFSLGIILYEMVTGKRAFQRDSPVESMTAIIREEPEPIQTLEPKAPAQLCHIIERCLAKDREDRYASTLDLVHDLAALTTVSESTATAKQAPLVTRRKGRWALLVVVGALVAAAFLAGMRMSRQYDPPSFHQLTFRRGSLSGARFAPDGQTIVYGASWDGQPIQLFATRLGSPEARTLGLLETDIMAISPSGEMAVSLGIRRYAGFRNTGTLARVPLAGGAPRDILEGVQGADWAPDGASFAVVRAVGGLNRLEYPIGKVLYETAGALSHPRVSPDGQLVAFLDHPSATDDGGSVVVIDRQRKLNKLSGGWASEEGLAWSPRGDEVWFTASPSGLNNALYAITLSAKQRLVARVPARLTIQDIFRDGRVLLSSMRPRSGIMYMAPGTAKERDLAWLDWSRPVDFSADGKTVLFDETGEGGGPHYAVYVRKTDGSPAVRLGDGLAASLSPDGRWAITLQPGASPRMVILPTGPGEASAISVGSLICSNATWFPDGKRILLQCSESGLSEGLYVKDPAGDTPRPITPGRPTGPVAISPDGKLIAALGTDGKVGLYAVAGNAPPSIPTLPAGLSPIQWSPDGRLLYLARIGEARAEIYRLELATGRNKFWREVAPEDPAGLFDVSSIHFAADGNSYVYRYRRRLSDLYLVEGLR